MPTAPPAAQTESSQDRGLGFRYPGARPGICGARPAAVTVVYRYPATTGFGVGAGAVAFTTDRITTPPELSMYFTERSSQTSLFRAHHRLSHLGTPLYTHDLLDPLLPPPRLRTSTPPRQARICREHTSDSRRWPCRHSAKHAQHNVHYNEHTRHKT